MKPTLLIQDSNYDEWCEEEIRIAYKNAATFDNFMFGDYDYQELWLDNTSNDTF